MKTMKATLTIKEAADILRVSESSLRRNVDVWEIPNIRNGNRVLILTDRFFREFLQVPEKKLEEYYDTLRDGEGV